MRTNTVRVGVICGALLALLVGGCQYFSTDSQIDYGLSHYNMGLYNQAIPPLLKAAKTLEKESPPDPRLVDVLLALGSMASSQDRNDLALDFFPRALKAAESLDPPDKKRLRNALVHVGNFYSENEKAEEAFALLSRAADLSKSSDDPVLYAIDLDNIGVAYARLKRHEEAISFHRSALAAIDAANTGSYRVRTKGVVLFNLAYALYDSGDMAAAESGYRESLSVLESAPAEVEPWRVRTVKKSYAQLLEKLGRNEEAAALLATVNTSPKTQ